MTPLRIGIVGAGSNTRSKHIPLLQALPGVVIDVVCNRRPESAQRVARDFAIPRIASRWEDVVADPDLDAIVIGTWPCLHAPVTLAALAAGKHVLCEARMAMDEPSARAMRDAARAHPELVAQIVPSPFTLPWDRALSRMANDGTLGRLVAVDVFATSNGFLNADRPMTWREDPALSGLNTLTLGIYYEAMARWVGHAHTVRALARVMATKRRDEQGTEHPMTIPDHLDVFGELENGASYHLRCSNVIGGSPTPNDIFLYGTEGTLHLNLTAGELSITRPGEAPRPVPVPAGEEGRWQVEEDFIHAIRGAARPTLTDFETAYRYMSFTQAVHDDLHSNRI